MPPEIRGFAEDNNFKIDYHGSKDYTTGLEVLDNKGYLAGVYNSDFLIKESIMTIGKKMRKPLRRLKIQEKTEMEMRPDFIDDGQELTMLTAINSIVTLAEDSELSTMFFEQAGLVKVRRISRPSLIAIVWWPRTQRKFPSFSLMRLMLSSANERKVLSVRLIRWRTLSKTSSYRRWNHWRV